MLSIAIWICLKWETGKNLPETGLLPDISKILVVSIDSILIPEAYPVKRYLGGHYIDGLPLLRWGTRLDNKIVNFFMLFCLMLEFFCNW